MKIKNYILMLIITFIFALTTKGSAYAAQSEYPEIIPENLTSYSGYNYLGTLENGKELQEAYRRLNDSAWSFYCSNEAAILGEDKFYHYPGSKVDVSDLNIDNNMEALMECFENDNPIYYFCITCFGLYYGYSDGYIEIFPSHYWDDDNLVYLENYSDNQKMYRELIEKKLQEYYDLTKNLPSDYEKERAIHDKLISEVEYSDSDIKTPSSHNIIGVFSGTLSVCEGYSGAMTLICNYCGVECVSIEGKATIGSPGHEWNAVNLDGEWYCVDLTWDDEGEKGCLEVPYYGYNEQYALEKRVIYGYLNMPYDRFVLTHKFTNNDSDFWNEYNQTFQFSNDLKYGDVFIVEDGDKTEEESLNSLYNYIKGNLLKGELRSDVYFYGLSYPYYDKFKPIIEQVCDDIEAETGIRYDLMPSHSWSAKGIFGTLDNDISKALCVITFGFSIHMKNDKYEYYKRNIVDKGIHIEKTTTLAAQRMVIPETIDGLNVTVVNGWYDQVVLPKTTKVCLAFAKQLVIPEGAYQVDCKAGCEYGIYLPSSVRIISIPNCLRDEGFKIYGYADSNAEQYAKENDFLFEDISGLEKIDEINIDMTDYPIKGAPVKYNGEYPVLDDYKITEITCDTEDEIFEAEKEYTIKILIQAKDGMAITPNTLANVNGSVAKIQNFDAKTAVVTFDTKALEGENTIYKDSQGIIYELNQEDYTGKIVSFVNNGIVNIIIPDEITVDDKIYKIIEIKEGVFSNTNIEIIKISKNVDKIGNNVFSQCSNLREVLINSTLDRGIGTSIFAGCTKELIVYGVIESTVELYTKAAGFTFEDILLYGQEIKPENSSETKETSETKKTSETIETNNTTETGETSTVHSAHSYEKWLITKKPMCNKKGEKTRICAVCGYKETVEIAATGYVKGGEFTKGKDTYTIKKIKGKKGTVTYKGSSKLTKKVSIPKTIKVKGVTYTIDSIAEGAFKGNKKIRYIIISENITRIGKKAFMNCRNLKTITIKSTKLKFVGKDAIKGVNKKIAIKVPKSKEKIYTKLFKKSMKK